VLQNGLPVSDLEYGQVQLQPEADIRDSGSINQAEMWADFWRRFGEFTR
jgi:hypothetical protein